MAYVMTGGVCPENEFGTPPGKLQDQDVGDPMLASVKVTFKLLQPVVGFPVKLAMGALMAQLPALREAMAVGPQEFVFTLLVIIFVPPAVSLDAVKVLRSVLGPIA